MKFMTTRFFVDTNVLIYSLDVEEPEKQDVADKLIKELLLKNEMVLSSQNLAEFSKVLLEQTNPPQNPESVMSYVYGFMNLGIVVDYSKETVIRAITINKEYKIHFFDALLVATMQENGIDNILTENTKDFSKVPWLNVRNPFKK